MSTELKSHMNDMIACCGLDCAKCDAYNATINDDDEMRRKVAKIWSELNGVDITPEMINCLGCRREGVKTPFCESMCQIRICCTDKGYPACGECGEMESCQKLSMVIGNNNIALSNLKEKRY